MPEEESVRPANEAGLGCEAAEPVMKTKFHGLWCVKVAYHYGEEPPRDELECDVRLFRTKDEALKCLEAIIRDDWTAEVEVDGKVVSLADCRGMQETDSLKYSDWYYAEDGTLAWSFYSDAHGYKGWVEAIEIEGEDHD